MGRIVVIAPQSDGAPAPEVAGQAIEGLADDGFEVVVAPGAREEEAVALASQLDADVLALVVDVERLEVLLGPRRSYPVDRVSPLQLREWLLAGQVRPAALAARAEAACGFAEHVPGTMAVLAPESRLADAIRGETGTIIQA